MSTAEVGVHPVVAGILIAFFEVLINVFSIDWKNVDVPVGGGSKPGEVVYADDIGIQVLSADARDIQFFGQYGSENFLSVEYLVAAAEGLDLREGLIKGLDADGHWVGIVDDPRLRRVFPDSLGDLHKHWNGTHGSDVTARSGGIADGLVNAVFLRGMDIGLHLVEGTRKNGDDHKIRTAQCFLQGINGNIGEV